MDGPRAAAIHEGTAADFPAPRPPASRAWWHGPARLAAGRLAISVATNRDAT